MKKINNRRQHNWSCKKPFWTKKENEAVKDKIIRDIRNLFVRVGKLHNNNYIEHNSNSDKIKPYQSRKTMIKLDPT